MSVYGQYRYGNKEAMKTAPFSAGLVGNKVDGVLDWDILANVTAEIDRS